jgi:predicted DNA-binding transcriptional regulator AlpA
MLLNKHNLNIAALCSKEQSRFTLNALYVTPTATVETDGQQMVLVTLPPETKAETFPELPNSPKAVDDWKPFLLPASEAAVISKALPKKSTIPVLQCAAVTDETDANGHSAIAITDLEMARVFRTKKPEGNFPDYERVIPKSEAAEFQISLNAAILAKIMKQIESFQPDNRTPACTFSFSDAKSPVRIDATGGDNQQLTAVVMPMRAGIENKLAERRKKAETMLDEFVEACTKIRDDAGRARLASELFLGGIIQPEPEPEPTPEAASEPAPEIDAATSEAAPVESPASATSEDIIDSYELAKVLKINLATVYARIKKGKLPPPNRDGKRMTWKRSEVVAA